MTHLLLASLGGAIGAGMRFLVGTAALRLMGPGFPYGTFFVNVAGSLAMGLLIGFFVRRTGTTPEIKIFLTTGLLGGFTTFSAFSLDAINLWERGQTVLAAGYVMGSVVISLAALIAGLMITRSLVG